MRINGVEIVKIFIRDPDHVLLWHSSGQKSWLIEYKNGVKHGKEKAWGISGNIQWDKTWKNGKQIQ